MKKSFVIITVLFSLTACGNSDLTGNKSADNAIDSAAEAMKDSVQKQSDTTQRRIDSSSSAMKDSIKAKM
jgi:hypothetical protein